MTGWRPIETAPRDRPIDILIVTPAYDGVDGSDGKGSEYTRVVGARWNGWSWVADGFPDFSSRIHISSHPDFIPVYWSEVPALPDDHRVDWSAEKSFYLRPAADEMLEMLRAGR